MGAADTCRLIRSPKTGPSATIARHSASCPLFGGFGTASFCTRSIYPEGTVRAATPGATISSVDGLPREILPISSWPLPQIERKTSWPQPRFPRSRPQLRRKGSNLRPKDGLKSQIMSCPARVRLWNEPSLRYQTTASRAQCGICSLSPCFAKVIGL